MPLSWDYIGGDAYLRYNYRGIGYAKRREDGKWPHVIRWHDREYHGIAASLEQAQRWMERWVRARKDLPVAPKRRSSRR